MRELDVKQFIKTTDKYKSGLSVTTYDLFALVEVKGTNPQTLDSGP
jgi:hypothetical protein